MNGGILLLCLAVILFFVLMLVLSAIKIVPEYERGVVFRLGRLVGPRGPGLFFLVPIFERMVRVDTRVITMDVPAQEVITLDNVTIKVNAVLYFMVVNPSLAVVKVMDYIRATMQIAQTTLRSAVGQVDLDTLLAHREELNSRLQKIIDEQTEPWGVKVTIVEVKDVELPQSMQRAMAKQAEAEREKRAKIIHAAGEFEASQKLAEAADVIAREPVTLQLRYLQTLTEIAVEKNSTIIFPLPVDTIKVFTDMAAYAGINGSPGNRPSAPQPPPEPQPSTTRRLES
ncbi:MAG TPA: slipin family protein [Kouleothrix sp.]|uniref:slipin family protein n=1 Tax=Kouleothrix sp. TaxID=2779161 RepID=UPI002C92CCB8|nr:slipin family protein [Kouleothrix sp.]HRC75871.1 slipin family protein [Kouleothrix sp.]